MMAASAAAPGAPVAARRFENLALVGMEAAWSGCSGLEAFERMVHAGATACIDAALDPSSPTQPAMLGAALERAARAALLDAGVNVESSRSRIAVLYACWAAVEISLPWASAVTDLSASENPLVLALSMIPELLSQGGFEAVVYAAAAGQPSMSESTAQGLPHAEKASFGFGQEVHGWRFGSGAGAVVWMDAERASQERRRMYAVMRAVGFTPPGARNPQAASGAGRHLPTPPVLDDIRTCCRQALEAADCSAETVGYMEMFASGVDALDGIEIAGTVQSYRQPVQDIRTAIGSAQANAGYLDAAAGLAGLVRASLCLYHRTFPGLPGWTAPKLPALWRGAPFYVPGATRTWFQRVGGSGRVAALNVIGLGGSFAHLLLSERDHPEEAPHRGRRLGKEGFTLLPLTGENAGDLLEQLRSLQKDLAVESSLTALATNCWQAVQETPNAPYALAVVGHDPQEAAREIELALKALPGTFEKGTEWLTPAGSYFTAAPAGRLGEVALVYPGAFNTYPGVAQDLFYLFPELHQRAAQVTADIGGALNERMVYPRQLAALSKDELSAYEARLLADPIAMLTSGTALTILYTHILQEVFAIQTSAAFGYSLGENSMMYATGVWAQGEQASERLAQSDVFRSRLAGPRLAIRESWGMSGANHSDSPLWSNYLVMAPPEKVRAAMEGEQHVYLTHINTPRQVVIGGNPEGCQRVLAALRASSLQAPFDYALHCAPMRSEFDALAELHHWPVEKTPALRMYSAADYDVLRYDSEELAGKMAHMLTSPLDFPRLIQRAYADGARVFIEAGAGSNCSRWVSETLKGSPHLAISMDRRGSDDASTLVRTAARLFCHRVPMDLSALFQPRTEKVKI